MGGAIYHESIGPQSTNMIDVDFSYTLEFEESKLAFGLKAAGAFYRFDRSKMNLVDADDYAFQGKETSFLPNIGAGLYNCLTGTVFLFGVMKEKLFLISMKNRIIISWGDMYLTFLRILSSSQQL